MFRPPRLSVRHLLSTLFTVLFAVALLVLPAAPASAEVAHANLHCTNTITTDVHPPITPEFRHHFGTSHGLTGTADCTGTVDGYQVTGTGIYADIADGTGNCDAGSGKGIYVMRIPTTDGTKTVIARWNYFYDNVLGTAGFTGDLSGTSELIAFDGDCVNTPFSHNTSVFTGTVIT
jgi:hypothetical protein